MEKWRENGTKAKTNLYHHKCFPTYLLYATKTTIYLCKITNDLKQNKALKNKASTAVKSSEMLHNNNNNNNKIRKSNKRMNTTLHKYTQQAHKVCLKLHSTNCISSYKEYAFLYSSIYIVFECFCCCCCVIL